MSSSARPSEEDRFAANSNDLSNLVHELISKCWEAGYKDVNPILIPLAQAYLNGLGKVVLIRTFITHSHTFWEEIRLKKESFFIEHSGEIFGKLPVDKGNVDAFKMLFTSKDKNGAPLIETDDRDAVWEMFGSMVKISIKYIHRIRECYLEENKQTGKMMPRYRHNEFPEIKIREHAKKWDIDLEIPKV
jgi:hypothetical protein